MKLESLLAPYLYQHKKLNLPGIGTFETDQVINIPEENEKQPLPAQGIRFSNKFSPQPDDALIDFIKTHTGKMRPLAMSDLESYLMLSKQFLNIGKVFYIEGIGTLQKANDGSYTFSPGEYLSKKPDNSSSVEKAGSHSSRSSYREEKDSSQTSANAEGSMRKLLFILIVFITLGMIVWGGYYLYRGNTEDTESTDNSVTLTPVTPAGDSSSINLVSPDSSLLINQQADQQSQSTPGSYKFILETTTSKKRALTRYQYVNNINRRIQLEAPADSSSFRIFVTLPASPADSSRLKDSLNAWYYGKTDMRIKIEQ